MFKTNVTELIGGTPLLKLANTNIYAKLEYFNPLHSVKDRAAYYMLKGALERGELKRGGTVIEPTSGNTGIGLAYVGAQMGLKVILVMPDNMTAERVAILRILGAELVLTPAEKGMKGSIDKAYEIQKETANSFIPNQFENLDNPLAHYETTAKEIIEDLGEIEPDYLVVCFGSGGTITGLGKALKERYHNIKVIAVEPESSPLLSSGKSGVHGIPGIGANFIPKILDTSLIDECVTVKDMDAKNEAINASREYGTFIGISSGAALSASKAISLKDPTANIITLFPDTAERYLGLLK
ncbi:MAG: cysteine synthase family protein [Clostridia bacterium]|nr:cysteine synthase family protein [Clostridia bacterium]